MALGGAGIAYAASSSGSSSSTTPSTTPSSGLAQHRHPGRFGFGFGLGGRVVHGEYTVQNGRGGYTTILVQTGKASSVSSSSITVTSTDGYKHNYAVVPSTVVDAQRDGIGTVGSGDQVRVIATSAAGKDTASDIVDTSKVASGNAGFGLRGGFPGPPGFGTFNRPANLPAGANPPALPAGPASS